MHAGQLPLSSCLGVIAIKAMAIATCLDCVFPSLHVCGSGCFAMAIGSIGACGTGVGLIEAKSMCPTVKHLHAIIRDDIR